MKDVLNRFSSKRFPLDFVFYALLLFAARAPKVPVDFEVPLLARDRLMTGIDPYIPNEVLPYKYSPFAALPYYLLPANHEDAWFWFKLASIAAVVLAIRLGRDEAPTSSWRRLTLLGVGMVLAWKGFAQNIFYGQLECIILAMVVVAARYVRAAPIFSGIVIGILPWLKIPLGFMALPFLLLLAFEAREKRDLKPAFRFIAGLAVSGIACGTLIPFAAWGVDRTLALTRSWLELVKTQPRELFEEAINQSVWMVPVRWLGPETGPSLAIKALIAVLAGLAIWQLIRKHLRAWEPSRYPLAWVSPWILLNQIINPLGWVWGGLYVLGVPLSLERSAPWRSRQIRALFLGLCAAIALLWLVQYRPVPQWMGFSTWEDLFPYCSITLFWITVLALAFFP